MDHEIEVIGLGAGDLDQLPLGIYKKIIKSDGPIFVRTMDHPVIEALELEGVLFEAFDSYYEREDQFEDVYQSIVETLLKTAEKGSIIYAVPGHPMLAEKTVQLLLAQSNVEVKIGGGQSYLDDLFTSLKMDPIDGFQFVDGTSFERDQLNYRQHIIFCQVYDRFIASEVKLALLEDLPAEYLVTIVEAVGSTEEVLTTIPLNELDHSLELSNLTSVYIPPVPEDMLNHTFTRLKDVISTLRGPGGCPWDQAQTHESLRKYLIEEVYELIDAIDMQDDAGIIEELGDVLLQVMLHSQIGEDAGYFVIDDVIQGITNKMIVRHPHVFSNTKIDSVDEVMKSWEELKQVEKGAERASILDGVSQSLPSLSKASHLQSKAAKVGFHWDDVKDVWLKLDEELYEVREAIKEQSTTEIEKELGDVLFVIANLARYYEVNPEIALNQTNEKFIRRFQYIEKKLHEQGKDIKQTSLEEMDDFWDQAKRKE